MAGRLGCVTISPQFPIFHFPKIASMKIILPILFLSFPLLCTAQDPLPYKSIPDHPEKYTAGAVASRIVDGLGFRFYWATEGLREEDLNYRASEDARTTAETIDHIYVMSLILYNSLHTEDLGREDLDFAEKRIKTLQTLKRVSDKLHTSSAQDMEGYNMALGNGQSLPFWNMLIGPIADCLWHCGQIVSNRRASGNPFNSEVSLLRGKLRE